MKRGLDTSTTHMYKDTKFTELVIPTFLYLL